MSTFTIILLLIIMVLIASDVFFLWRIFKTARLKKKSLPDERYFELKYNINLLKAVSAILIFLLGFLGFTTYNDITEIVEGDFEEKFKIQEEKIEALDSIVKNYESLVESLKSEEGKSIENLNDVKREFGLINEKVARTQERLKLNPRIFVVRDLKFKENIGDELMIIYYNQLKTIYGERLPKFGKPPIFNVQGNGNDIRIVEKTDEFVKLDLASYYGELDEQFFDIWIVNPD